jgi:hypothetical protein
MSERRTTPRRSFSYYVRVLDDDTQKTIGHLIEMSATGIQLETSIELPLEKEYFLRMELMPEISSQSSLVFAARAKWCKRDTLVPNNFFCGFEILEMVPEDHAVFLTILEKFGKERGRQTPFRG